MSDVPVRRLESNFEATDTRLLVRRAWVPAEARRSVVLVHGFGEHSGRYDDLGTWLAARGSVVHAYDQRGHGLSAGLRNHVRDFDELVDDLERFLEHVLQEHSGLPQVLIGHSMGGLVVAKLLCERSPRLTCAVTSGAALALSPDVSRARRMAARLLRHLAPTFRTDSGLADEGLATDPEVARRYRADPLVNTTMTAAFGAAMMDAVEATAGLGARVSVPLLMLHGGDDPLCLPSGTKRFFEAVAVPGSHSTVYPGLRHEIFNEPERERVYADVLGFVERIEAERARP